MSGGKPYIPPDSDRYDSEADYPDRVRDSVESMRQKLNITPPSKVKPEFITLVNSDRKFVEVSESFYRLLGYRREELIGKPYDDVTAPNTNDIPTVFRLFSEMGTCTDCGCWPVAEVPTFWFDMSPGFGPTLTSKVTWS